MKLTYYEELTLEKINNDLNFFVNNSLKKISEFYNISDASIVRLFKKLGYSSLKQMQMDYYSKKNIIEMTNIKVRSDDKNTHDVISNVSSYSLYSIFKTNEYIFKNEIDEFAAALLQSKKIISFGIGNSGLASKFLSAQFIKIGLNCFTPTSVQDLMIQKEFLGSDDIMILFSTSLKSKEIRFLLEKSPNFKFKIAIFTDFENKSKCNYDFNVFYSKHNLEVESFPGISSLTSQIYAINIVFSTMLNKLPNIKIKRANNDNFEWNNFN